MYIVIHTESTKRAKENAARHLADAIWRLPGTAGASCVIVEMNAPGQRYCVVGDPPERVADYALLPPINSRTRQLAREILDRSRDEKECNTIEDAVELAKLVLGLEV